METGDENAQFRLVEIAIPLFAVSPVYENAVVPENDIAWLVGYDFFVRRIDDEWSELVTQAIITMKTKDNKKKIAEMILKSFFEVTTGLSTEVKKTVLHITINQTMAQAQGAWTIMNSNPSIANVLPQALEQFEKDSEQVKEALKKKWGKWSKK